MRYKNFLPFKSAGISSSLPDVQILILTCLLCLFGLVMVYDASVIQAFKDYGDKYYYIRQQLSWIVLGLFSLSFFSIFPYQYFKKFAGPMLIFSIILLLAVFIPGLGFSSGGAHRWLRIAGITIQPAEIVKLTSIIFFAKIFEKKLQTYPFAVVLGAVCVILGILQRDLGSTIVYLLIGMVMYFMAGAPISIFLSSLPIILITALGFIFSSDYRKHRILAFLDPFSDPQGYSYHISQILIALGSGGWLGLGFGQSKQKFEYIPEVTTDSIFAIMGEELGFIGGFIFLSVFVYYIFRGFNIAQRVEDKFGRFIAFGIVSWLGFQALVNLASMVALIPLTGVPLPFISYGGSALLINLTAVGILLNISKHTRV